MTAPALMVSDLLMGSFRGVGFGESGAGGSEFSELDDPGLPDGILGEEVE